MSARARGAAGSGSASMTSCAHADRRHRKRGEPLLLPGRPVVGLHPGRTDGTGFFPGGRPAITLSDSINSSGGDWGADGYVYIEVDSGIARIRSTGGAAEPVYRLSPQKKEIGTELPNVLPGGSGSSSGFGARVSPRPISTSWR